MKLHTLFIFGFLAIIDSNTAKTNSQNVIDNINDIKELKKLYRTKTNMLILFTSNPKECQASIKTFRETAEAIKGLGTMVLIDCSSSDKKKLCKKLKVNPSPLLLKHYKDGDFHKDYDRQITVASMVNFMRDPTGDLPWEEDPTGADVIHITEAASLTKFLKKETRPTLVMFYAPWCGFCKQLKPEYSLAATELKPKYILSAIDVDRPENAVIRRQYNITGFPTLLYYENGKLKYTYEGENNKAGLISFMENPAAPPIMKPKADDWSTETSSEIVHLTATGFEPALKEEKSVLVMFYAPWCGHCKRMKPEYEKAALIMKKEKIPGILAALDATKEAAVAQKYNVKGYPTVKYFVYGELKFDVNVREADKIVSFMKDPKEPPPPPPPERAWDEEETEVVHLNDDNFKSFLKKKKHALVMFYAPWCGHCKKAKPEFSNAAEQFKDDPRVALAAIDCTKYASICSFYEVRGYPTLKYFSYLKTQTDYKEGRTQKDFVKFLVQKGSTAIPTAAKSENENEKSAFDNLPGAENIIILSDNDFDDNLKKATKSLILFHTPWCSHCRAMKNDFALAAKRVAESGANVQFGAIDCDGNNETCEKHKIQSFPTVLLFENGKSTPYTGVRKADDFVKFVLADNHGKDEL